MRDPDFEALWVAALWDGLQLQWRYHPDSVDVANLLDRLLTSILADSTR